MNKVILIGRIATDIRVVATTTNKQFVSFTLAVQKPYDRKKADFIQIKAWNKTAEIIVKYTKKGDKIALECRIESSQYQKDGKTIYNQDITIESIELLESKNNSKGINVDLRNLQQQKTLVDDDMPF